MEPGRELDIRVAENVFGLRQQLVNTTTMPDFERIRAQIQSCPEYSTDLEAAWTILDRLPYFVTLTRNPNSPEKYTNTEHPERTKWTATISSQGYPDVVERGRSAPHAICLAAAKVAETW